MKGVNDEVISIPGMLVASLKPPSRRKARVVAMWELCSGHTKEVSAGGLDLDCEMLGSYILVGQLQEKPSSNLTSIYSSRAGTPSAV